jgi:UDP-3-O-[3-hydroxymyristoyl] glucosamine N-acyltransferase
MSDSRFFSRRAPLSLAEIAKIAKGSLPPSVDGSYQIEDVAPLQQAGPKNISFFDNIKYKQDFMSTKAGACIVHESQAPHAPEHVRLIFAASPYKSYALVAQAFYPPEPLRSDISVQAYIDPSAILAEGCVVEAGAVIKAGAKLGQACVIESGAVIGRNVIIGAYGRVGANSSLSHCVIGDYVNIYPGVRIGQDGFGFAIDPAGHVKVPQLGRVIIGDHVEVGANTCIDRGSGPDTIIGQGTWIDNLVQIAHNVTIGKGCVIVSQVGISGSTVLEDFVVLAGQVGVAGHLRIGKGAQVAGKSGVIRSIPAGQEQMGYPSQPLNDFMRQAALLKRLIKKDKSA